MRLIIPRRVSDQLVKALREAGARETGGILMGEQIKEGCFRVHEATVQSDAWHDRELSTRSAPSSNCVVSVFR